MYFLLPEFVDTEADFARLKARMVRVRDVKTFKNFLVPVPASIDPGHYNTVTIWCESFGQFITAAQYRWAGARVCRPLLQVDGQFRAGDATRTLDR